MSLTAPGLVARIHALHERIAATLPGLRAPAALAFSQPAPGLTALGEPGERAVVAWNGHALQVIMAEEAELRLQRRQIRGVTLQVCHDASACRMVAVAGEVAAERWKAWQIGLARCALDAAQMAFAATVEYTRSRMAFGVPIGKHQMVAERVAACAIDLAAVETVLGEENSHERTGWALTTLAGVAGEASKLMGGHGYLLHTPLASLLLEMELLANLVEG